MFYYKKYNMCMSRELYTTSRIWHGLKLFNYHVIKQRAFEKILFNFLHLTVGTIDKNCTLMRVELCYCRLSFFFSIK